jgi:hypothetical protein
MNVLLYVLKRVALLSLASGRPSKRLLAVVDSMFRLFIGIWKENERLRKLKEEEENSQFKYKTRSVEVLTDEQREEQDLEQNYPTFAEDFLFSTGDDDPTAATDEKAAAPKPKAKMNTDGLNLSADHMSQIYVVFTQLFSGHSAPPTAATGMLFPPLTLLSHTFCSSLRNVFLACALQMPSALRRLPRLTPALHRSCQR